MIHTDEILFSSVRKQVESDMLHGKSQVCRWEALTWGCEVGMAAREHKLYSGKSVV